MVEQTTDAWELAGVGPATLADVIKETDRRVVNREVSRFRPLGTGFDPLDDVLNGGLRRGELMMVGGAYGVGKTIFGLQIARNTIYRDPNVSAMYVCYEHDRVHLMSRLLCLESAEIGDQEGALTLRRLSDLMLDPSNGTGLVSALRRVPRYAAAFDRMETYASRLQLVKASGDISTLDHIRGWVEQIVASQPEQLLLVVDYLQKIPVDVTSLQPETEVTTHLAQGLKELAMAMGIPIIAIAASDRPGLKAKRMRLADLRGSSALQYEADVGIVLNNKHSIVSREHLVYNLAQAETMRNWVILSVEKNRAGRNTVDMEFAIDAAHFRIVPAGGFVRERLVDEKVTLD
jgi:replicative DNA helicase